MLSSGGRRAHGWSWPASRADCGESVADGLVEGERAAGDVLAGLRPMMTPRRADAGRHGARRPHALAMGGIDAVLPAPFQNRMGGDEPAVDRGCGSRRAS